MSRTKNLDCLQVVAEASVIYEIDKSIRYLYGNKLSAINRIPYVEPEEERWASEKIEYAKKKLKKQKHSTTPGGGRLQYIIRECLLSGKRTVPEIAKVVRENHMSSGNIRVALGRMQERGEVRRQGKYWMRTKNGSKEAA